MDKFYTIPIDGDETQRIQRFQNLIGNGLKFHRKGVPPVVKVNASPLPNTQLAITVSDNDIGLAMAKRTVESHQGTLNLGSIVGDGTTFTMTLLEANLCSHEAEKLQFEQKKEEPLQPAKTILIVEDDEDLLMYAERLLKRFGYQTVSSWNADEALRQLEQGTKVDILFTDVRMPGKLDGLSLARRVHQQWPETKILITTGFHEEFVHDNVQSEFPVLFKSYLPPDLERAIEALA